MNKYNNKGTHKNKNKHNNKNENKHNNIKIIRIRTIIIRRTIIITNIS